VDPQQVSPDPESMRSHSQLEAALVMATCPGGSPEPAFAIAEEMVSRGLLSSTPARAVALTLFHLTLQHLQSTSDLPDPYTEMTRRLVESGRLHQEDVDIAVYGTIFNTGLAQGWLDAATYDELERFGGPDPEFRTLLARIARRA
jgi:hypothetical protein